MDRFMEAVKDLQIKQLTEYFMTAGNLFLNREEHPDNDNMYSMTSGQDISQNINNDDENKARSISRTYNTGGKSYWVIGVIGFYAVTLCICACNISMTPGSLS